MRERIEAMLAAIKDWQDDDEQGYMEATNLICGTLEGGLRDLLVLVLPPPPPTGPCTWLLPTGVLCGYPADRHEGREIRHTYLPPEPTTAPAAGGTPREA